MLIHPTLDTLQALKLTGMQKALIQQMALAERDALSFDERFGMLVDAEWAERENRRMKTRLKRARLRQLATIEDIDYRHPRGLDKPLMLALAGCEWVRQHHLARSMMMDAGFVFRPFRPMPAEVGNGHTGWTGYLGLRVACPRLLAHAPPAQFCNRLRQYAPAALKGVGYVLMRLFEGGTHPRHRASPIPPFPAFAGTGFGG